MPLKIAGQVKMSVSFDSDSPVRTFKPHKCARDIKVTRQVSVTAFRDQRAHQKWNIYAGGFAIE